MHHVAGLRINEHRATRAFKNLTLHRTNQCITTAITLGGTQGFVNHAHAIVGTDCHKIRPHAFVSGFKRRHEFFVHG